MTINRWGLAVVWASGFHVAAGITLATFVMEGTFLQTAFLAQAVISLLVGHSIG